MYYFFLLLLFVGLHLHLPTYAQTAPLATNHASQGWVGYVNQYKFKARYGVWNDIQYNPTAFLVFRTGLSYHWHKSAQVTLGYAWVITASNVSDKLVRREHRPWGQVQTWLPIKGTPLHWQGRIRYDMRIRQVIAQGQLTDRWATVHRLRYLTGLLINLNKRKKVTFLNIFDELLLNYGKDVQPHTLDQNRIAVVVGKSIGKGKTFQIGYMNRMIPQNKTQTGYAWLHTHSLICWFLHQP